MKLRVLAVGRLRQGFAREGVGEYADRIQRLIPFEMVEVPSSSAGEKLAPADECARLAKAARRGARLVLFDERGRQLSTADMARSIDSWMNSSTDVDLVIGGAWGVTPAFRQAADEMWALSGLTMPHELARVLALEAAYRALTVIRGLPYHHG